jgi:hypothetical protein
MSTNYVQHGKIGCPVCGKQRDHLKIWRNIGGVPYCACEDCIDLSLDDPCETKEKLVEALLRMGFRAGREHTSGQVTGFLSRLSDPKGR